MTINEKFKSEIDSLTPEEYASLEASLLADGCRDALITWNDTLVDGHNRYEICTKHNIPYSTVEKEFADENEVLIFIAKNQLSRRNLNDYQKVKLGLRLEKYYAEEAKKKMLAGKSNPVAILPQGSKVTKTRDKIAKDSGVGSRTVSKVKKIEEKAPAEIKQKLNAGTLTIEKAYKTIVATEKKETRKALAEEAKSLTISIDLRHGDFKTVLADIADGSVDVIITDPPYPYEYIQCWSDLAEFAKKKLKPNGFCIAYSGQFYLPEVMKRMGEHLDYYWTFCLHHTGQGSQIVNGVNLMCRWKPILIYQNGKKKISNTIQDYIASGGAEKDGHDWQQSQDGVSDLIRYFTNPNDLVVDTFAGSATTLIAAHKLDRRCIGAEIDEESYNIAKSIINKNE